VFVQINTKTEYSFLDSVVRIDDYLSTAEHMGYKQLGICDHYNLHAAYRFAQKAYKKGIQPILAIELPFQVEGLPISISFIAKNAKGYKNLLSISSYYNYGRHQLSDIENFLSDLALVIPEAYGDLSALSNIQAEIYVGVTPQSRLGEKYIFPLLPFPSVRYLRSDDSSVLGVLQAVREGSKYDESLMVEKSELLQRPEIYEQFFREKFPQSLVNLEQLVSQITYDFEEELELPKFDKNQEASQVLRKTAENGLKTLDLTDLTYKERLNQELSVIHAMGFDDYFLIVGDLLTYAKKHDIYCGMGRGSAAGSLVAYALGITQVDPVANNLIFERFLNMERVAMPDIDIDMPDDRRGELLSYMKNRYGSEHVAQIVTFSTLAKRQSLRDVGKAYGLSEVELSNLTRMLAYRFGTLADEYEGNPKFKAELLKNSKLQHIYEVARRIEGMPRQTSTHASGVVLAENSLINYTALKPSDDLALTQYEAPDVEAIGLLKIDFLGLRNLSLIARMIESVEKKQGIKINPLEINLEDEQTLELFRQGNTLGIFQFENPQMRRFLRNLAPTRFDDIVDATSIFRPGPSQFIPQFVARRHGKEEVQVVDASIADILAPTYGIMIYQEQIMQVAQRFAGFSLGKADLLRRAISKKKGNEFEKLRADFLEGAVSQGHSKEKAQEIYDLIERFANYGFNRSHAYAYAALAFQIAYFKANYPAGFYEVQLKDRKRETMILDAIDNGFIVERPSINAMPYHDKLSDGKIFLGLAHVSKVPRDMAFWIVDNRPFADLSDLIKRLPEHFQREEYLNPLIESGVFDAMDDNRKKLADNLARLIEYHQTLQLDLFGNMALQFSYQNTEDYNLSEKYIFEKENLGIGVTPHPLQHLAKKLSSNFTPLEDLEKNKRQTILVELLYIRTHRAKTGTMAFLTVSDSRQNFDVTIFPEQYRQLSSLLEKGNYYLMTGKVSERNDELQMIADKMSLVEETEKKLWLNLENNNYNQKISQILKDYPGSIQVILHDTTQKTTQQTSVYVEESEQLIERLQGYVLDAIYK